MFGLIMDHPFHDANKRTAFLSTLHYLYKHGRTPTVTHEEFEDFTVDIAEHRLDKYARYKDYLKDGKGEPECRFISHYLRSKTRELDKRTYYVTYRDLKRILNSFGFDIENQNKNYIDVVRLNEERGGFFFRKTKIVKKKVAQIGFPGWTKQVRMTAIDTVRKETGLTVENGVDSQVFFNGVEPLQKLIAHYEEPLRRLAAR
jgi:death-on-curing protein